ncbi:aspartate 1-decarboxylase [Chelatococcus sp. SYSU_G07232]|uniref:Aspartate 1-decarboxylase n=1 Tax=Chelatococcus albus TaxID=3047466 RepID=A0ABT7ALT4_9HYPH|nr:aspartate 1-decarboxylase [Chelatococcus sp. SYSU_G07232]MDJ1159551.1 aspartate 1-decarboxylase [Chelatococcus sp. SYSU_G07232]
MLQVVRAKLHAIRVTGADLNYHGSITLDPDQCTQAGIRPLEFVDIFNKNNGARWYTYVIFGKPGSRCCVLNGAAARNCQKDDELIICASAYVEERALYDLRPKVLTFGPGNVVEDVMHYEVYETPERPFDFRMVIEPREPSAVRRVGAVDVEALARDLRARGLDDHAVADVLSRHLRSVA